MGSAQHSSANDAWRTPPEIIEMVRTVLGGIDVDCATDAEANLEIGARYTFAENMSFLDEANYWGITALGGTRNAYCNPPGGRIGNRSRTAVFWEAFVDCVTSRKLLHHGIFAFFNLEALAVTQSCPVPALAFPVCIPRKRVRWVHPDGLPMKSPPHSAAFAYVPGATDRTADFVRVFGELGRVVVPYAEEAAE